MVPTGAGEDEVIIADRQTGSSRIARLVLVIVHCPRAFRF